MSMMFFPHFDLLCDLLLNRRTATWNLLVLDEKETNRTKFCLFQSKATREGALLALMNFRFT